jgi:hypothetical protein
MPSDVDFLWNFLKPVRSDLVKVRLCRRVTEVLRVCPVEQVNVHVDWLRRFCPEFVIKRSRSKFKLLKEAKTET